MFSEKPAPPDTHPDPRGVTAPSLRAAASDAAGVGASADVLEALRRARDYAESIVANVRVPLVVLDAALRVKTASVAFYSRFHVATGQTEGRPIYDLGNRQWDIPALRTLLEEILPEKNEIADYEVRHTFEELGPRIMMLNAHRLAQAADDEPLIILSIEDITDREAGAEEMRASEERFRMIADNMSQLAWTCAQLGDVTWYNQRWLDYTGLTFAEMKEWGWTQCQHPDHVERVVASVTRSRDTGVPWEDTFPLRGADGQYRWFLSRAFPIRDAEGEVVRWFGTNTDITALRETEDALRRSEERFRTAVSSVSSLIWTNNAQGMMEGEQPGWGNFTGQTQQEYQGYGWAKAVHPGDAQPTIERWGKAVAEKRMFEFEHRVRRADGEWRLCSIRAVPLLGGDGAIREWVGVHTDITERKRTDEVLRASEERLSALVTASSDVIYRMSADWREMGPLDGLYFLTEAPAPTRDWVNDNLFPEDQPDILAAIREAIRTKGVFALEHRVRRADGSEGWTVSKAVPILDARGEITEWFGAASDVTERHQTVKALRTSEAFKHSIIESSPDCIKVLDLAGNLLSLEAGHELLGVTDITPLLGTSWMDFWLRAEDHAAAHAAVAFAGTGGEGKFVGFLRTLHGLDKWWDVAVTPIRSGDGTVTRLLSVSRDVTERREMEDALVARAQELVQADRSKDEFLAMLAHELRNPLAPLRNSVEILKTTGTSDEERAQAQQIISRQIENMSRMLDDLLDVSRITEGKISLRTKPVALEAILTAAASLARSGCAARQQELSVTMPGEPIFLDADATRLEQVFGNLLNNACKYSGDGCHIALSAERAGGEVIVRVADDGAGIAPEILPRIFDLFVQSTRSLDRAHGGLGIGLTLVRRLVDLHGGSIEARSEGLGHGAEFIVRLPILAQAPPAPAPTPRPARETPRRILIVDDNSDSARSLATLQTRGGHEAHTAFTGPDGLAAAAELIPEVILLDIGLPGMDGFEVARRIRALPALAGVVIIAMSGYGSVEDRAMAREAGFDHYLVKPVDLSLLRELLRGDGGDR